MMSDQSLGKTMVSAAASDSRRRPQDEQNLPVTLLPHSEQNIKIPLPSKIERRQRLQQHRQRAKRGVNASRKSWIPAPPPRGQALRGNDRTNDLLRADFQNRRRGAGSQHHVIHVIARG